MGNEFYAFSNSFLKSITIPRSLEIIGSACFYGWKSLLLAKIQLHFNYVLSFSLFALTIIPINHSM
jgi:hypothetical protein